MGILDQVVEDVVNAIRPKLSSAVAARVGSAGGPSSTSTSIASVPPISQFYSGGAGQTAGQGIPSGGGGFSLPSISSSAQSAGSSLGQMAGQIVSNFGNLPSIQQKINMDLATSQAMAFGSSGSYAGVQALQRQLAASGTIVSPADAMVALQQSSLYGMGTGRNLSTFTSSTGAISNLMPGLGVAGSGQAFASLQSAQNVNMLRAMGVNIRSTGNQVTDFNSIITQLWSLLTNLAGRQPTEEDIQGSMLPGNFLYRFLSGYGGDSNMQQSIYQGLLARAKGVKSFSKTDLQRFGFTTGAVTAQSQAQAADMTRTQTGLQGLTKGFEDATNVMSDFKNFMTAFLNYGPIKNFYTGLQYLKGGASGVATKAEGGPTQSSTPYIIGEKGPEVFIPKTDGYIIPNHMLPDGMKSGTYKYAATGADVKIFATQVLKGLGAPVNSQTLNAMGIWAQREQGWVNNTASYNPFDTTYQTSNSHVLSGGGPAAAAGVQAYSSFNEGVQATINTLLYSDPNYGYSKVIKALRSGKSTEEILRAINSSSWGSHDFKGLAPIWNHKGPTYNVGGGNVITNALGGLWHGVSSAASTVGNWVSNLFGGGSGQKGNASNPSAVPTVSPFDMGGISAYIASLNAGTRPQFGDVLAQERALTARAKGGQVKAGVPYQVGEVGAEAYVPSSATNALSPRYVIEKIEINVPSGFTEEGIMEMFKRHTDIKEIERKARVK